VHDFSTMKKSIAMIFMLDLKQKCVLGFSIVWAEALDLMKCVA